MAISQRITSFPTYKGTYVLLLQLTEPKAFKIGKLGTFEFGEGWYTYVGSALGSGGLRGRLKRHISPVQKPHWHIDYLRQAAQCREIWYRVSNTGCEHDWADILNMLSGGGVPVPRFGASDCRCETHLFYFREKPVFTLFRQKAGEPVKLWNP